MKLEDKIYCAIEDEERRFDEMNYKSIGLYNNRYNELFEKRVKEIKYINKSKAHEALLRRTKCRPASAGIEP